MIFILPNKYPVRPTRYTVVSCRISCYRVCYCSSRMSRHTLQVSRQRVSALLLLALAKRERVMRLRRLLFTPVELDRVVLDLLAYFFKAFFLVSVVFF